MALIDQILQSVQPPAAPVPSTAEGDTPVTFVGDGDTCDVFDVGALAAGTVAAAATALARYAGVTDDGGQMEGAMIEVDRRLANFWFTTSLRPMGWTTANPWDDIAGDYRAKDGWIRLHTNAPHHRAAACRVLGGASDRAEVTKAVLTWAAHDLQDAVVEAGGVAAMMMSASDWASHPQGQAVAREPLVTWGDNSEAHLRHRCPPKRPLSGLKVLDLTRILAGPVATRFLAGFGADVLRIDPPGWDEVGNIAEMTPGKRCATLDLSQDMDKEILADLIATADVMVHGYRPDALARLGFDADRRRALNPALIDVALNAYGWTGPWHQRRGFDSLVQMSSGIADAGRAAEQQDRPRPMTVQALDHGTGYLMAAAVLNGLCHVRDCGQALSARLSLAATAEALKQTHQPHFGAGLSPEQDADINPIIEDTDWGPARRLNPPVRINGIAHYWQTPATRLHSAAPRWQTGDLS